MQVKIPRAKEAAENETITDLQDLTAEFISKYSTWESELAKKYSTAQSLLEDDCEKLKQQVDDRREECSIKLKQSFQERLNKLTEFRQSLENHKEKCEETLAEFERKFIEEERSKEREAEIMKLSRECLKATPKMYELDLTFRYENRGFDDAKKAIQKFSGLTTVPIAAKIHISEYRPKHIIVTHHDSALPLCNLKFKSHCLELHDGKLEYKFEVRSDDDKIEFSSMKVGWRRCIPGNDDEKESLISHDQFVKLVKEDKHKEVKVVLVKDFDKKPGAHKFEFNLYYDDKRFKDTATDERLTTLVIEEEHHHHDDRRIVSEQDTRILVHYNGEEKRFDVPSLLLSKLAHKVRSRAHGFGLGDSISSMKWVLLSRKGILVRDNFTNETLPPGLVNDLLYLKLEPLPVDQQPVPVGVSTSTAGGFDGGDPGEPASYSSAAAPAATEAPSVIAPSVRYPEKVKVKAWQGSRMRSVTINPNDRDIDVNAIVNEVRTKFYRVEIKHGRAPQVEFQDKESGSTIATREELLKHYDASKAEIHVDAVPLSSQN